MTTLCSDNSRGEDILKELKQSIEERYNPETKELTLNKFIDIFEKLKHESSQFKEVAPDLLITEENKEVLEESINRLKDIMDIREVTRALNQEVELIFHDVENKDLRISGHEVRSEFIHIKALFSKHLRSIEKHLRSIEELSIAESRALEKQGESHSYNQLSQRAPFFAVNNEHGRYINLEQGYPISYNDHQFLGNSSGPALSGQN